MNLLKLQHANDEQYEAIHQSMTEKFASVMDE